jgi:Xaa-Pro dipeptidase
VLTDTEHRIERFEEGAAAMAIRTYGPNAVDWEQRIDIERLRVDRLARLKAQLEASDLGSLLTFDFSNIRYMT